MKIFLILLIVVSGCSSKEKVFVPGPDFYQSIELTVSSTEVKVGEEVALKVRREADGWLEKFRYEVDTRNPDVCWYRGSMPPKREEEVSPNIIFMTTPEGYQIYNTGHAALEGRTVRFTKPGKYKIKGHSSVWCAPGVTSNTVTITVQQQD